MASTKRPSVRTVVWPALILAVVALALVIVFHIAPQPVGSAASRLPLRHVAVVTLPGHADRFDYAADDARAHLLWLAHMGDSTIVEFNTATRHVVRVIPGIADVTGIIVVPALHRVFASAPGAEQVVTIDERSGRILARAPAGAFPDGLAYVPTTHQVWVSAEEGGVETVIDARTGRAVATVPLGGQAGNVRYDQTTGRVLVDVQTLDQLAVIDPKTRKIKRRVRVPGCDHDHGLLVGHARAFVACDGNSVLVIMRVPGFRALGRMRVGTGPDVLALDPGRHLLYVAAESGVVAMINITRPAGRLVGRAWLGKNAHVVAVDPLTHDAFFPLLSGRRDKPELLITAPT